MLMLMWMTMNKSRERNIKKYVYFIYTLLLRDICEMFLTLKLPNQVATNKNITHHPHMC